MVCFGIFILQGNSILINEILKPISALGGAFMASINCYKNYQGQDHRREQNELEECKYL